MSTIDCTCAIRKVSVCFNLEKTENCSRKLVKAFIDYILFNTIRMFLYLIQIKVVLLSLPIIILLAKGTTFKITCDLSNI